MKRTRRRLSDLYVRGKEVEIDDGSGDPVKVWLQKPNPIDRDTALRRAHAVQARYLIEAGNEESELWQSVYGEIRDTEEPREALIGFIIGDDIRKYRERVAAEKGANEETWGKENYLNGLVDAWLGDDDQPGLAAVSVEDPDDPEAKRVLGEIERFEAECKAVVDLEVDRLTREFEEASDETVWRRATDRMLQIKGTEIFSAEFERQQLFFSVREIDDHTKRYFSSVVEMDDLDDTVRAQLRRAFTNLMLEPNLGKSSGESRDSSSRSESSPAAETSPSSGPVTVSA